MSTKPSTFAEWDTTKTHTTATTADHKTIGFAEDEVVESDELNHWMGQVSDWTKWLLDGDVDFASLRVTGAHVVALSANQLAWDPLGTTNLTGAHVLNVAATAGGPWTVSGLIGGVNGLIVRIVNNGTLPFYLRNQASAATAADRLAFPLDDVAADADVRIDRGGCVTVRYDSVLQRWRVLSTSGCRVKRQLLIPGAAARVNLGAITYADGAFSQTVNGSVHYPIVLPIGATIAKWELYYNKNSDSAITLLAQLKERNGADGTTNPVGSGDSTAADAPGYDTLSEDVDSLVSDDYAPYIETGRTNGGASDQLFHAIVDYWAKL